jgi:LCP family protein required for cell wall assembly
MSSGQPPAGANADGVDADRVTAHRVTAHRVTAARVEVGTEAGRLEAGRPKPRWRRRLRRIGIIVAALTAFGALAGVGTGFLLASQLTSNLKRIDGAFKGLNPSTRPSPAPPGDTSQTILAVGLDIRSPDQTTGEDAVDPQAAMGGERSDTIMLIHFDPAGHSASVVSIPRDSWVPIPGKGTMKINAAYAFGGPSLLISTVEQLTNVRIDHFMIIDFAGFKSIVDALGGVDVPVAATTSSAGVTFHRGLNHLDGTQALAYVRQRHGLPGSDFDRVRRQQNFLRAVMTKIAKINPAGNPLETYRLLDAMTKAVTVDDGYSTSDLRDLALSATRLHSGDVWFLTAPVSGTGWEGDQSVVYLDKSRATVLWRALGQNAMPAYVAAHRADLLGATTP